MEQELHSRLGVLEKKLHTGTQKDQIAFSSGNRTVIKAGSDWCLAVYPAVSSFLCLRLLECPVDQNSTSLPFSLCSVPRFPSLLRPSQIALMMLMTLVGP